MSERWGLVSDPYGHRVIDLYDTDEREVVTFVGTEAECAAWIEEHEHEVCDFCNEAAPTWQFPAEDVSTTFEVAGDAEEILNSRGSWLACDECRELIVAGKRDALVSRSMESIMRMDVTLAEGSNRGRINDTVRAALRRIHDDFWKSRRGAPVPYKPPTEGAGQHG